MYCIFTFLCTFVRSRWMTVCCRKTSTYTEKYIDVTFVTQARHNPLEPSDRAIGIGTGLTPRGNS